MVLHERHASPPAGRGRVGADGRRHDPELGLLLTASHPHRRGGPGDGLARLLDPRKVGKYAGFDLRRLAPGPPGPRTERVWHDDGRGALDTHGRPGRGHPDLAG